MQAPVAPTATVEAVPTRKNLLAAMAGAFVFLLLARWVLTGDSMFFDLWIRDAVHAWASPLATRVLLAITMLGSEWVMLPLGALLVWRLATIGRGHQAVRLATGGLSAELVSHLLKLAFHRPRPEVFFGLSLAETYSFPSGHAFVSTVFYGLLAGILMGSFRRSRRAIITVTASIALTIGFSRVYLGYHYPSDVLGGWTCAAAWLALTGAPIYRAGQSRKEND
jgi:membrane-associated phospholipid phosphatase